MRIGRLDGLGWLRHASGLRCAGHDLRRHLSNFTLELREHLLHNIFIIWQVGFEPLKRLCLTVVTAGIDKPLKLLQLLVGHLIGQSRTNP